MIERALFSVSEWFGRRYVSDTGEGEHSAYRQGQVVQRRQGLRFSVAGERRGRVRPRRSAPEGVEALKTGQKVEFGMAAGRRGPQALAVTILDPAPSVARNTREAARSQARKGDQHTLTNCTAWWPT